MQLSKRTQRYISSLFSAIVFASHFAQTASAQIIEWKEREGCVYTDQYAGDIATIQGFECLVGNVLATATTFIGLAAFVMFIIGGFLYLTSGGNTKGTEAGKQTITYAVIGIVVALLAFFLLQLVAVITGARGFLQFNLNIGN